MAARVALLIGGIVLLGAGNAAGAEVGFLEDFALADDREKALEQLIPGTRDYYFYHCLHYQNVGRLDEVDRLLEQWIKRYRRTRRVIEIENRQALLRYGVSPQESLEFIRRRLGISFNHQRQIPGQKPTLPTRLDPDLIGREALTRRALAHHRDTVNGFEDRALEWVSRLPLDASRRRHLLGRLERPDVPDLPRLVVDDLRERESRGFGSHPIHHQLLIDQLEECVRLLPGVLNDTSFVQAYLRKLQPNPDVDWRHDAAAREAYLERLQAFVSRLNPSHNSLRAHVLYHRLVHDRERGVHDRARLLEYIQLPRHVPYINERYMRDTERRRHAADLNADYTAVTLLPRVGNDEPIVRAYLEHFFLTENSFAPYANYIREDWLERVFAETKILAGIGDMERWYSMLPPSYYQNLKERVDLDFAPTNPTVFTLDEQVALDLWVKNVETLIVKIFEINTTNFYRTHGREVDTAIDLDGLVANQESTYSYTEPSLRRVRRHFEFPQLQGRGTWVIEFIGNGKSSRALVRRGRLRYLTSDGAAGQVVTVLDESNRVLPDASIWVGGREYRPEKDGTMVVPYSNDPGRRPIVLVHGDFASLDQLDHAAESYRLAAGFHVEREDLIKRTTAAVLVRPSVTLNGTPVTLSVLEDVALVIRTTDRDGVSTTKEIKSFEIFEDRESVHEFNVPADLVEIRFALRGRIEAASRGAKEDYRVEHVFTLNQIDRTEKVEDLFLGKIDGRYSIDLLGKTGEVKPHRPVHLRLKHGDFRDVVDVTLQSDEGGRIELGELEGIEYVEATGPEGTSHRWVLASDLHSLPGAIHGRAGETLRIPYMGTSTRAERSELSLLEVRGDTFFEDRFSALDLRGGFIELRGLAAGDYSLFLKDRRHRIAIRLTDGEERDGRVLSGYRQLEVRNPSPVQIASVGVRGDALEITLANSSRFVRVHVAATRYVPEYDFHGDVDSVVVPDPGFGLVPPPETLYVVGRDIGDEYRYILERKQATRFPGNMLERPGLLLNPWAIRSTETTHQLARPGSAFDRRVDRSEALYEKGLAAGAAASLAMAAGFSNLDFLGDGCAVLTNLRPDDDGVVRVPREQLGGGHHVHVVAVDPLNTVSRHVTLAERETDFADLRLEDALDPERHFTEQKRTTVVRTDARFVIGDITTSEFEVYDSLDKVYALLVTLSGDPTLVEFGFVTGWPRLKPEEKREKYSRYACHELNVFLLHKDPEFFLEVVRPYLENKHHKTFIDHWLLGDDLAEYTRPWTYGQLNIPERIFLSRRIEGERARTGRHVEDLFDLLPPDIERQNHIFATALRGRSLESEDDFGIREAEEEARAARKSDAKLGALRMRRARAAGGPGRGAAPQSAAPVQDAAAAGEVAEESEQLGLQLQDRAANRDLQESLAQDKKAAETFFAQEDLLRRQRVRQLYRKLDPTKEWVENNYYHLPIEQQNAELITVNAFWRDYARHSGEGPFLSTNVADASRNFAEMMLALAVLDLPFEAEKHTSSITDLEFSLEPGSPLVVFHKEIREAQPFDERVPILVSQNFYRHGDRYRFVNNERFDKFVTEEFLVHTVYGCHVVITNPTSSQQKLDVLLQIPRGAMPVLGGKYTRSVHVVLEPYHTWTQDYFFYFPAAGSYSHYPVHVGKEEKLVAFAPAAQLSVVEEPTRIDRESWEWISQNGTADDVIGFLEEHNLGRVPLDRIAWRMQDRDFFRRVTDLLSSRHVYDHTLWSYGIRHDVPVAVREYLRHSDAFVSQCGAAIASELLVLDPVERKSYQHMEYRPLVNARSHRLGKRPQILNDRFYQQYMRFMRVLSYRPALDDEDTLGVAYYMFLQDRVDEGLRFFERVRSERVAAKLQYDYLATYVGFYTERLRESRAIAGRYQSHPVDRWRNRFVSVASQLDEIESGRATEIVDPESRDQKQTKLAATEASFDFEVEARKVSISYQNLDRCRVNYYLMDIELLFSRNPFVQQYSDQFSFIRPNMTVDVDLDAGKTAHEFELPGRFHSSNVLVEIVGGGVKKSRPYFANSLAVQLVESYAQLRVTDRDTGKPLPRAYVKVYARLGNGGTRFYKDGYTDLRGRFDYGSLSTGEIDQVSGFAILVLSDEHGAVVQEAVAPQT